MLVAPAPRRPAGDVLGDSLLVDQAPPTPHLERSVLNLQLRHLGLRAVLGRPLGHGRTLRDIPDPASTSLGARGPRPFMAESFPRRSGESLRHRHPRGCAPGPAGLPRP